MTRPRILGRYEVLAELGVGGWARVCVARPVDEGAVERRVALKVLHEHLSGRAESVSSFLDEARVTSRLRHPNVVSTLDVGATREGLYFLALELVHGPPLTLLRDRAGERLPRPIVLRLVADALSALAYVHGATDEWGRAMRIVHRDLTPKNLLVGQDGVTRVSDFGIASGLLRAASTTSGAVRGTIGYMSPEQVLGEPVDHRTDLFALGVVLWELATGTRLFRRNSDAATLLAVLGPPYPMPSSVDRELEPLDALVTRALARDREHRFASAEDMLEALHACAGALGGIASPGEVASLVRATCSDLLASIGAADASARHHVPSAHVSTASPAPSELPYVGRDVELARTLALLDEGARLITITGMGGIGKTRLLREVAARLPDRERVIVELADVRDAHGCIPPIAAALSPAAAGADAAALAVMLAKRGRTVLLLDNLEQLGAAVAPLLESLLAAAPHAQLVVTSRALIGSVGEHVVELVALDIPAPGEPLTTSPAGRLLAALLDRRGLPADDERALAAILTRIGGVPLAIELVAARLDTLSPPEVLARLDRQLALLTRPDRGERRWNTMEACVEWSWSLLRPHEQEALTQLAVFERTFETSWAEAVLDLGAWQNAPSALDVLASLRSQSLVQRRARAGRSHALEIAPPVRELALDRLARRGGQRAALTAHAAAFALLAGTSWHEAFDASTDAASRVAAASGEIVTAIVRALDGTVSLEADALAALLAALAARIEHLREGHRLVPKLEVAMARLEDAEGARASMAFAAIARIASSFHRADVATRASAAASNRAPGLDPRTTAEAARAHAYVQVAAGIDDPSTESRLIGALAPLRAVGDRAVEARVLADLADLARWRLDPQTSVTRFREALDRLGPERAASADASRMRSMLVESLVLAGEVTRARAELDRVLASDTPAVLDVVTRRRLALVQLFESDFERSLETALSAARDPSSFALATQRSLMFAAIAAIAQGRIAEARQLVEEAQRGAPPHEQALAAGLGVLADTASDSPDVARERADELRATLDLSFRPVIREAVLGILDLALLPIWPEPPRNALRAVDRVLERSLGERSTLAGHPVVRAVAHVVRGWLLARDARDPRPRAPLGTLLVGRDGRWFVTPGGEWVDCQRRPMIGGLVSTLAAQQGDGWIETGALLDAIWPGDRTPRPALRNRLHVLIANARQLGLGGHLEARRGAYRLARGLPVRVVDGLHDALTGAS